MARISKPRMKPKTTPKTTLAAMPESRREHVGRGDPGQTLALLWGGTKAPTRGPKPALDVERIVVRAIALADAEGLAAVSLRRVADAMAVSAMALYTYVPGKGELFELMVDRALREQPLAFAPAGGWRRGLERYAHDTMALYQRHPWLLQVASARAVLGPHVIARLDAALALLGATRLRGRDKVAIVSLVESFTRGAAAAAIDAREARAATGESDDAWWQARAARLDERLAAAFAAGQLATLAAVASDQGFDEQGESPDGTSHSERRARAEFAFGLERLLDGVAAFIRRQPRTPRTPRESHASHASHASRAPRPPRAPRVVPTAASSPARKAAAGARDRRVR